MHMATVILSDLENVSYTSLLIDTKTSPQMLNYILKYTQFHIWDLLQLLTKSQKNQPPMFYLFYHRRQQVTVFFQI